MSEYKEQVERIAQVCHEANRAYCATLGDMSQVPWENAPAWQQESAKDGVHAIMEGRVLLPSDSHAQWFAHKQEHGWTYGPEKDPEKREHPCMVPFKDLPLEEQKKDELFFAIVTALE